MLVRSICEICWLRRGERYTLAYFNENWYCYDSVYCDSMTCVSIDTDAPDWCYYLLEQVLAEQEALKALSHAE